MSDAQGNFASLLNTVTGQSSTLINEFSDFIGTLADFGGALGVIIPIIDAIISSGQPDEIAAGFQQLNETIEAVYEALGQGLNAQNILDTNQVIEDNLSQAKTNFLQLQDFINTNPSPTQTVLYVGQCITALNTFDDLDSETWSSPANWQIYWTDKGRYTSTCLYVYDVNDNFLEISGDVGYQEQMPAVNSDGSALTYQYALPAYLSAILYYIAVGGALQANFYSDATTTAVLNGALEQLITIHNTVLDSGITKLCPPDWGRLGLVGACCPAWQVPPTTPAPAPNAGTRLVYSPNPPISGDAVSLATATIEYGAVDKYSGFSSMSDNYQLVIDGSGNIGPATFRKLQIRLLKRAKDVYVGVGLPQVLAVIYDIRKVLGIKFRAFIGCFLQLAASGSF